MLLQSSFVSLQLRARITVGRQPNVPSRDGEEQHPPARRYPIRLTATTHPTPIHRTQASSPARNIVVPTPLPCKLGETSQAAIQTCSPGGRVVCGSSPSAGGFGQKCILPRYSLGVRSNASDVSGTDDSKGTYRSARGQVKMGPVSDPDLTASVSGPSSSACF